MAQDVPNSYNTYPLDLPRDLLDSHDLTRYHTELGAKAPQLFIENDSSSKVEICEHCALNDYENRTRDPSERDEELSGSLSPSRVISTKEGLHDALKKKLPEGSTRIINVHRTNSWSRMKITLDMFKLLRGSSQANPCFPRPIEGMGFKTGPNDEHFMSCYSNFSMNPIRMESSEPMAFDICYNVRHFENHRRDLEDPWSSRQSVVHQKYGFWNSFSTWIVVQPPVLWKKSLEDARFKSGTHPLALHLRFISSAISNNREYLNFMSDALLKLDQRISIPKPLSEFDFDFSLSQSVHTLRRKLHHLKMILSGTTEIIINLSSLAEAIEDPAGIPLTLHEAFMRELAHISVNLKNYNSTTNELLDLSNDIKSTINSVLDFRNQELLNRNSAQLQQIAENEAKDTKSMGEIARWTYSDSRTMRIATLIALVYLPANLVFSFFSTIFVEFSAAPTSNSVVADSGGMFVHEQLWIAVVSITVLILSTIGAFWVWDRRGIKSRASSC